VLADRLLEPLERPTECLNGIVILTASRAGRYRQVEMFGIGSINHSQMYHSITPSESVEPEASKVIGRPTVPEYGPRRLRRGIRTF